MRSQFDGCRGFIQWKPMRDKRADVQFSRKHQTRHLFLQEVVGGVTADKVLLIDADSRQVQRSLLPSTRMREEQDLPATPQQALRLLDNRIRRHRNHCSIKAASVRYLADQIFERTSNLRFRVTVTDFGLWTLDLGPPPRRRGLRSS